MTRLLDMFDGLQGLLLFYLILGLYAIVSNFVLKRKRRLDHFVITDRYGNEDRLTMDAALTVSEKSRLVAAKVKQMEDTATTPRDAPPSPLA